MAHLTVPDDLARRLHNYCEQHGLDTDSALNQLLEQASSVEAVSEIPPHLQRHALDFAVTGITIADATQPDFPLIYVNPAFEQLTGYVAEEILGQNCRFLQGDDRDQEALDQIRYALKQGEHCKVVLRNYRKDGEFFWNELTLSPTYDENGTLTHFIGIQHDITALMTTQHALTNKEADARTLFTANPLPMMIYDIESYQVLDVNNAAIQQYGYDYEEFCTLHVAQLRPEEDVEAAMALIHEIKGTLKSSGVWRHMRKDGAIFYVEVVSHALEYRGHNASLAVVHDVTERVHMQAALEASEKRYRMVSELSSDYAFALRVTPDGLVREWMTDAFYQVTGFTQEESEARGGWTGLIHPDDLPEAGQRLKMLLETGSAPPMAYRIITKSGEERHIFGDYVTERDPQTGDIIRIYGVAQDITERKHADIQLRESEARFRTLVHSMEDIVYTLDHEGRHSGIFGSWVERTGFTADDFLGKTQREILGALNSKVHEDANQRAFNGETVTYEWQAVNAGEISYYQTTVSPMTDAHGDIASLVGVGHDITALKNMERERIETEKLRLQIAQERDFLDLKQQFISMVSHEFRNPLAVILSSVGILDHYRDRLNTEQYERHTSGVREQIKYMTRMLDDVLMLNRANAGMLTCQSERFELASHLRKIIEQQQSLDDGVHTVKTHFEDLPATFYGDRVLIQHILENLLSNALKYSPEGTNVCIEAKIVNLDVLQLYVKDSGIGIPLKDQKRLFQPFHRAENVGNKNGTGLGLSIVKICADAHGGTIDYESIPGKGTTFTVNLPECR